MNENKELVSLEGENIKDIRRLKDLQQKIKDLAFQKEMLTVDLEAARERIEVLEDVFFKAIRRYRPSDPFTNSNSFIIKEDKGDYDEELDEDW